MQKLLNAKPKDTVLDFEETGFDYVVVDESHNYKNGLVISKMQNVAGVVTRPAQKSEDMLMKCDYLNEKHGFNRVLFASGTPISNSMTEMYTTMQYLRPDLLKKAGLQTFDDWASTFGQVTTQMEMKPAGDGFKTKKRFNQFINLPELITVFHNFAD